MILNFSLTDKGNSYMARSIAGRTLRITGGAFGNGIPGAGVIPTELPDLINPLGPLHIIESWSMNKQFVANTLFSNKVNGVILDTFYFTEACLYGHLEDENGNIDPNYPKAMLAYGYISQDRSDCINGGRLFEFEINWVLEISGSENITVVIDDSILYPTKEEFNNTTFHRAEVSGTGQELHAVVPNINMKDEIGLVVKLPEDLQENATLSMNDESKDYPIMNTDGAPIKKGAVAGSYISVVFSEADQCWYLISGGGGNCVTLAMFDERDKEDFQGYREAERPYNENQPGGNFYTGIASKNGIDVGYIEGRSEQVKTNGYQLFDASNLKTTVKTGVAVTNNGDGSFTIKGNGNLAEAFSIGAAISLDKSRLKEGNIRLFCGARTLPYCGVVITSSGGSIQLTNFYGESETKALTADILNGDNLQVYISISGNSGEAIVSGTIKPMLYQDGDGTWEEFSKGFPSPSVDYPQEIKSFGDESVNFHSHGFQLIDTSKLATKTAGGATVTNNQDGTFTVSGSGAMTEAFGVSYTTNDKGLFREGNIRLSCGGMTFPYCNIFIASSGGSLQLTNLYGASKTKKLTADILNGDDFYMTVAFNGTAGTNVLSGTIKPILYQDGDGEWEEFKELQTAEVTFPAPLRSLPNGVHDTYENGKIVRRVGVLELDGDENWFLNVDSVNPFRLRISDAATFVTSQENAPSIYCDKFIPAAWNDSMNETKSHLISATIDTVLYFRNNDVNSDLTEWAAWLASNPVTVYYELAAPVVETFAIPTLTSYNPNTAVHHDSEVEANLIVWHILKGGGGGGLSTNESGDLVITDPTSGETVPVSAGGTVYIKHDTTGELYRVGLDDNGLYFVKQEEVG